jgi:hypothetical protein
MPTVKIKYVGVKKDGERAFKADTDIEWFPGDVHDVDSKVAEQMLRHPDVFVQVSGEAVTPAPAPKLNAVAADQDEVDDEAIAREEAAKKAKAEAEAKKAEAPEAPAPEAAAAEPEPPAEPKPAKAAKKTPAPPKVKGRARK